MFPDKINHRNESVQRQKVWGLSQPDGGIVVNGEGSPLLKGRVATYGWSNLHRGQRRFVVGAIENSKEDKDPPILSQNRRSL